MAESLKEAVTSTDQAYAILKEAIIKGHFRPGERLVERQLSEMLGVSRTPVREALRRLERERFVTTEPFRGVVITKFTLAEAEQVYQFRAAVEGLAAELLARTRTDAALDRLQRSLARSREALAYGDEQEMAMANNEFHLALGEECGNAFVSDAVSRIMGYVSVLRLTVWRIRRRPSETLQEHEDILAAVKERDAERARACAIAHVEHSWQAAKRVLEQEEEPPLPKVARRRRTSEV